MAFVQHLASITQYCPPELAVWLEGVVTGLQLIDQAFPLSDFPTMEELLTFHYWKQEFMDTPVHYDRSLHKKILLSSLRSKEQKEALAFAKQRGEQCAYQKQLESFSFPWNEKQPWLDPVSWRYDGILYASSYRTSPQLSIISPPCVKVFKEKYVRELTKQPFPSERYFHKEHMRVSFGQYTTNPWSLEMCLKTREGKHVMQRSRYYCHWKYAKEHPKKETIVCDTV